MNRGMEVLGAKRLTGIVQTLRDIRETPKQLLFLNRTRRVPAVDSEIMGRYERIYRDLADQNPRHPRAPGVPSPTEGGA